MPNNVDVIPVIVPNCIHLINSEMAHLDNKFGLTFEYHLLNTDNDEATIRKLLQWINMTSHILGVIIQGNLTVCSQTAMDRRELYQDSR